MRNKETNDMKRLAGLLLMLTLLSCDKDNNEKRNDNLDLTFDTGTGIGPSGSTPQCLIIQQNGQIIVGGNITSINGTEHYYMIRLNPDGSTDESFNVGSWFPWYPVAFAIQEDGKILVGGAGGNTTNHITRLNYDGTRDPEFYSGTDFNWNVYSIVLQDDGKIIPGGEFTSFNGISCNYIARLNNDGTLDQSFNTGDGFDERVFVLLLQEDNKILAGGLFNNFNNVTSNFIARLNNDGSLDHTFNTGSGFGWQVDEIIPYPGNKILVSGPFSTYNGHDCKTIARLNNDGSLDESFNPGSGFGKVSELGFINVLDLSVQSNGKIIAGGYFISYDDTESNFIARLNPDGTHDSTYKIGDAFNSTVTAIELQDDGKPVITGAFTQFNGTYTSKIARLNAQE